MSLPLHYSQTDTPNYGLAYFPKFSEFQMKYKKRWLLYFMINDLLQVKGRIRIFTYTDDGLF